MNTFQSVPEYGPKVRNPSQASPCMPADVCARLGWNHVKSSVCECRRSGQSFPGARAAFAKPAIPASTGSLPAHATDASTVLTVPSQQDPAPTSAQNRVSECCVNSHVTCTHVSQPFQLHPAPNPMARRERERDYTVHPKPLHRRSRIRLRVRRCCTCCTGLHAAAAARPDRCPVRPVVVTMMTTVAVTTRLRVAKNQVLT